jgi:hypothetical protein
MFDNPVSWFIILFAVSCVVYLIAKNAKPKSEKKEYFSSSVKTPIDWKR